MLPPARRQENFPVPGNGITIGGTGGIPGHPDTGPTTVFYQAVGHCRLGAPVQGNPIPSVVYNVTLIDYNFRPLAADYTGDADYKTVNTMIVIYNIKVLKRTL